ncbi:hypothetical protein SeMB42_g07266 [Synchytrium endobioticum]|uniref:Cwf19-like C-terminal domain-containing protein n=1 Tax=Synchytrium endobioticum TaxID=286115 RepID=A0A507C5M0_9FUNG|nr:hypothetical protein SeMB42_g07266 [Synchytrium endobioticum]TPX43337.1 hypothetical protein SeLEV6574_g05116 [Synchytrium endobioticum]
MSGAVRILVVGPVNGDINQFIKKVSAINAKNGPFTMLLVAGDFFHEYSLSSDHAKQLLANNISLPCPTYIMEARLPFPDKVKEAIESTGEVCCNLFALERAGITTTAEGLKIASVFGTATQEEIDNMTATAPTSGVDILITYDYPEKVTTESYKGNPSPGSRAMSRIAAAFQPKYHFACHPSTFYEREPYSNPSANHVARFLSLGAFGNTAKDRWFYAMNLIPISKNDTKQPAPPNTTSCPYSAETRKRPPQDSSAEVPSSYFYEGGQGRQQSADKTKDGWEGWDGAPQQQRTYFCRTCGAKNSHKTHECTDEDATARQALRKQVDSRSADLCWFCLSNPNLEKHLIVHIGDDAYITLPKGALVENGGHLILLPIGHYPSSSGIRHLSGDERQDADKAMAEVGRFKTALRSIYKEKGDLLVFFEIYPGESGRLQHMHIQAVAVPSALTTNLRKAFNVDSENAGLRPVPDIPQDVSTPYLHVDLDGETLIFAPDKTTMAKWAQAQERATLQGSRLHRNDRFNLQLGRAVLAHSLNLKNRVDWKNCVVPVQEETKQADEIKACISDSISEMLAELTSSSSA